MLSKDIRGKKSVKESESAGRDAKEPESVKRSVKESEPKSGKGAGRAIKEQESVTKSIQKSDLKSSNANGDAPKTPQVNESVSPARAGSKSVSQGEGQDARAWPGEASQEVSSIQEAGGQGEVGAGVSHTEYPVTKVGWESEVIGRVRTREGQQ
jgi:hypothetical protein